MARKISERKAKKKLGISDWGELTKEKIPSFATLAPRMDPEIINDVLVKLPEYADLITALIQSFKEESVVLLRSNDEGMRAFFDACSSILASLQEEIKNPQLTSSDREKINDRMVDVAKMIGAKDTENKSFLQSLLDRIIGGGLIAGAAVGGGYAGYRWITSKGNETDD